MSHTSREGTAIRHLFANERPREKLKTTGCASLTDAELLALLLGSGSKLDGVVGLARKILLSVDGNLNELARLDEQSLMAFKGIGEVKALSIIAAFELGRRRHRAVLPKPLQIRNSRDIFDLVGPDLWDCSHEEFWVVYLNRANMVIAKEKVSSGGISGTIVDLRIVMKGAVQRLASGLIVCHNHPSGNLKPSEADLQLTGKLGKAAELLDVVLLDHLIITSAGYYSFADEGRMR